MPPSNDNNDKNDNEEHLSLRDIPLLVIISLVIIALRASPQSPITELARSVILALAGLWALIMLRVV